MNTSADVRLELRRLDHPDALTLIAAIQRYYVEVYGGPDSDSTDPAHFTAPQGLFLIGYLDGLPVACGGWRRLSEDSAEIKRMFVSEAARGTGLARRMLAELEASAHAAGARTMLLNTGSRQPAAIALYRSSGYEPTEARYGHYADFGAAMFFAKPLPG